MAEVVLGAEDSQQDVVRALLDLVDNPDDVVWHPRPDVPHGGVYAVPDEVADKYQAANKAPAKRGKAEGSK